MYKNNLFDVPEQAIPLAQRPFIRRVLNKQLIASYGGERFHFPDALPGEEVFFRGGLPISTSAVKIQPKRLGFTHADAERIADFIKASFPVKRLKQPICPDPLLIAAIARLFSV